MALAASTVTPMKPARPSKPLSEPGRRAHKAFTALPVIDVAALLDSSKSQVWTTCSCSPVVGEHPNIRSGAAQSVVWCAGDIQGSATGCPAAPPGMSGVWLLLRAGSWLVRHPVSAGAAGLQRMVLSAGEPHAEL